jgi:hypothetical protein
VRAFEGRPEQALEQASTDQAPGMAFLEALRTATSKAKEEAGSLIELFQDAEGNAIDLELVIAKMEDKEGLADYVKQLEDSRVTLKDALDDAINPHEVTGFLTAAVKVTLRELGFVAEGDGAEGLAEWVEPVGDFERILLSQVDSDYLLGLARIRKQVDAVTAKREAFESAKEMASEKLDLFLDGSGDAIDLAKLIEAMEKLPGRDLKRYADAINEDNDINSLSLALDAAETPEEIAGFLIAAVKLTMTKLGMVVTRGEQDYLLGLNEGDPEKDALPPKRI